MQIEIKLDPECKEPRLIIVANQMNDEINDIVRKLSANTPQLLTGYQNEKLCVIENDQLLRIYSGSGKVYGVTEDGEYTFRLRLYEIEERLDKDRFVRISNSEIINLRKVQNFDLSLSGTICVQLSDHSTSYVSRRYVGKIKKILGLS